MPSETAKGWATRLNNVKFLFNNEKFALAEREARSLLDEPMLPPYYRIQCLVVLAQCLEEWHQAKYYQNIAEHLWHRMQLLWPADRLTPKENAIMARLRLMLDELEEDMLAEQPDDTEYLEDLKKQQSELAEAYKEVLAEFAEGDPFEEDVEMTDQKEKEFEDEEEETVVIKSDGVDFESHDLPLNAPALNPPSRNTNRESLSTEQSFMWSDTDKSKRSSFPLSSLGDFESPLKRQPTPLSFTAIRNISDSPHDLASASRLRQRDAATSPTFGKSEKKKAVIPGPSIPPVKEKEDTKIDKAKMIPRDVPDEPNPDKGVAGVKGKDWHITEMLRSGPDEEALKSRPSSPTKLKHSASARSSRTRPTTFDRTRPAAFDRTRPTAFERTAPATATAAHVSVQAESSRSRSHPTPGMTQSGIVRSHSTPLLSTAQNAGPLLKDGQTAAQESLRSSLRDSLNSGWTSTKSGISSTIGTLGRTLTHRSKRRPDSTAGSELGGDSQEGSTAGRDRRHKRKKEKKSSPALHTVFDPPSRK
ncbi:hypothetical protein KCU71_g2858, partial [Aureobasidium melanogenum]